jgi:hypothetical protein
MVLPAVDVEPTQPQLLELRAAGMSTFYLSRSNDTLLLTQIERVFEVNYLQVVSTEVSSRTRQPSDRAGLAAIYEITSVVDLLELFVVACHDVFPAGQSTKSSRHR